MQNAECRTRNAERQRGTLNAERLAPLKLRQGEQKAEYETPKQQK
jgi:hypothetical protein